MIDQFSNEIKQGLLSVSRKTIENLVNNSDHTTNETQFQSEHLNNDRLGAFVSVYVSSVLRGCLGQFESDDTITQLIEHLSIAAASQDHRFSPITKEDLEHLTIEISILTPPKKIKSIDEIILEKHGIIIKKEGRSGTFLPQVATKTGWNLFEFLGHCSQDKARLGWNGWKDADVFIYEAIVFSSDPM